MSDSESLDEKAARAALNDAVGAADEMIRALRTCPYQDQFNRAGALLAMMKDFEPGHFKMVAATAVERLSQFLADTPQAGDVANAEDFLGKLMAGFILSDEWRKKVGRDVKIQAMARGIFETCTPSQSALLVAVAIMRLAEGGQGPVA